MPKNLDRNESLPCALNRSGLAPARDQRREGGAALIVAILMLVLLGMIGLASMNTVMTDRQVAGHTSRARQALYAADAGVASGLNMVRSETLGAVLSPGDCMSQAIPSESLPNGTSFEPDPTAPDGPDALNPRANVCMLATAEPCATVDGSVEQGQQIYLNTIWDLRVQGRAPGGAVGRVHATVTRCHAFNN
jgi:hypothetical protein